MLQFQHMTNSMEMGGLSQKGEEKGDNMTTASILEKLSHNVETYEDFMRENALLEAFVDDIERNAPNGEVDTYSREFWQYYGSYIDKKTQEEYDLLAAAEMEQEEKELSFLARMKQEHALQEKKDQLNDYVFSGGTAGFSRAEHLVRLKQRTALHMAQKALSLDAETSTLLKKTFPLYNKIRLGYTVPRVDSIVLEQSSQETDRAKDELRSSDRFEEIRHFNEGILSVLNTIYDEVRFSFMNFRENYPQQASEIYPRYGRDYHNKSLIREMADVISQNFDPANVLTPEQLKFFESEGENGKAVVKKVIEAAAEASFLNNTGMSKLWRDSDGYSAVALSV